MNAPPIVVARGRSEGSDLLVAADGPLLALHRACGGDLPGTIAIPALLELTRAATRHAARLARRMTAQDGDYEIAAWVEIVPNAEGCEIALSNWRATALGDERNDLTPRIDAGADQALPAQTADLHARLDPRQAVLAVSRWSEPLAELARIMVPGRPWTDFIELPGAAHRPPLHWRLLDGATVSVAGMAGTWRAKLFPCPGPDEGTGFDLYLIPTAIADVPDPDGETTLPLPKALDGVLGRDLAPALRQPVHRIVANAETIRARLAGPLADEYAAYAADIAEAGRHLLSLVEDLADLDAIEAPGFAPETDAVDLGDAARRTAGLLAIRAQERDIVVHPPQPGEAVIAVGEWRRVLQILLNLLGNAIRYAPARTTVRLIAEDRGTEAAITVADEGGALDPAQQRRMFDKFERLGRSGDGGSGLGLYISRRLARAMGGDLTVRSEPGEGTRFTLTLPKA